MSCSLKIKILFANASCDSIKVSVETLSLKILSAMQLHEIISDAECLTDPVCMDRLLYYLEQLQSEAEEFMQMLVSNLDAMTVWWEQPWYQKTNLLTRPPANQANEEEQYRTDTISKEENDRIEKNWQKFRKKFSLPDKLICFARWRNKDKSRKPTTAEERVRKFVTAYLARGLQRNLYQVYKHIITWHGAPVKGKYSEVEEKIMEVCFHHAPQKAVVYLSTVLGREPRGIYKKLYEMYNGKREPKRLKWTLPLVTKLVKLVIEYSGTELEDLKNKRLEKSVWVKLEEDMDQYHFHLQAFWYTSVHPQIFIKYNVKIKRLRKKILKVLRTYPYQVWTDIRWKEVAKHFPNGFTHGFLYRVTRGLVKDYPQYLVSPLEDVINYGLRKAKDQKTRRLRTLAFDEQGNLQVVKYDTKF